MKKEKKFTINYGKQTIDSKDILNVDASLKNDFITSGPLVDKFEKTFAKTLGAKYAVAVSSATAALHLACLVAGLQPKEEVITSPLTFIASANCALYCGAKPVFVDIKEDNGIIDEEKISEKISSKTKIILPVHYSGIPCNLEKIHKIAKKHKLIVIEDACHALGAKYKNSVIGDCAYSDMAVFSFHPVKHITTGEGGMITTNNSTVYEKLKQLRNHAIIPKKGKISGRYDVKTLGFNYRITDFQCALGLNQLTKLKLFLKKRIQIAQKYNQVFSNNQNISLLRKDESSFNSQHLYVIKLKNIKVRDKLQFYLKQKNIMCQVHYPPVYLFSLYKKLGYKKGLCPVAEDFSKKILSLPIFPLLKERDQKKVINEISNFVSEINH